MTKIIKRTYNKHGDHDFLVRMEGNCPVWMGAKHLAATFNEADANQTVELIATYRDWLCPNGIQGIEVVSA